LHVNAPNHPSLVGNAQQTEKKSAKNLENMDSANWANLDRIAYWRKMHRCVNTWAQEYPSLILL
jgi:hypothetical protein